MRWSQGRGLLFALLGAWAVCAAASSPTAVKVGEASYFLSPKHGDAVMPPAPYRTDEMLKRAAPTSQWYSTLIFNAKPEVIFAQPLTFKATSDGLEMALPSKQVVPTERQDVEIVYPHREPLVISPTEFAPGQSKLAGAGDWSIEIAMDNGPDSFRATVAHGSPFAYLRVNRGDLRLRLPSAGQRIGADVDPRMLALRVKEKTYALFAPTGVRWEQASPTEWVARLPAGSGYLSAAALPDERAETLALFRDHAYAFIETTRVDWRFDAAASQMETTFSATTRAMEGANSTPLLGLYPHHWFDNPSVLDRLGPAYDTVRGKIRVLAAPAFKTRYTYNGFVPFWPGIEASSQLGQLQALMKSDARSARRMMLQNGRGPYWQGKGLQRTLSLMNLFEQQGDLANRDKMLNMMKRRIEDWFSGESAKAYFVYDKQLGAVGAYPNEFFFIEEINDHHFTYGYWIRTMAEIALRDPDWASRQKWGGMVDLLVADIATPERGRPDFPFLRNFDPYEGHSWASGIGVGPYGNNQEASSEAVNAWAGIILWAEVTGDKALRDLGIYMYTTEVQGAQHYVFDLYGLVLAPEYKNVEVSQLFGGAYKHNTWWTDEPRQIKGINMLPVTSASTYLGRDPAYVKRNLEALGPETATYRVNHRILPSHQPPADIWQDIFAKYLALADPKSALENWDRWGAVELGESRSSTLHWLLSLNRMGVPDFGVTADTALYSVFKRPDGSKTYLAFNAGKAPITVRFSDGKTLEVAPGALAHSQ